MTTSNFQEHVIINSKELNIPIINFCQGIRANILCAVLSPKPLPEIVRKTFYGLLSKQLFYLSMHQLSPMGIQDVDVGGMDFVSKEKRFLDPDRLNYCLAENDLREFTTFIFSTLKFENINLSNNYFHLVNLKNSNWGFVLKEFIDGRF